MFIKSQFAAQIRTAFASYSCHFDLDLVRLELTRHLRSYASLSAEEACDMRKQVADDFHDAFRKSDPWLPLPVATPVGALPPPARGRRRLALTVGGHVLEDAFGVDDLSDVGCTPAQRVVTLCPSNAEVVGALGCFDRVVACEDSSDWPAEVASRERLGPDLGPDLDRVAALAPDLTISSLSVPGMERNVTGLRVRGVRQRVLSPRSLDEVIAEVERVGLDLGVADRAAMVRTQIEAERAALRANLPGRPVRVYLEWWPRPMFSPGADCYSSELIGQAGGIKTRRYRDVAPWPDHSHLHRPAGQGEGS